MIKQKQKQALAYSYLRFSNPDQIKGDSQRRQLDATRTWCDHNEAELVEEFQDLGISAFRGKNRMLGVLARFLEIVRAGKISAGTFFIIENIDRLSREKVLEALTLYLELIKAGVSIVTLIDGQTHSRQTIQANPMVLQMAIASMARANEESEVKSRRINSAWEQSRADSLSGKLSTMGRLPCWLKRNRKTREPELVPKVSEVVRELFEMAAAGMAPTAIAVALNKSKRPTLTTRGRANHWGVSTIRKVLQAKAAMGIQVLRKPVKDEEGNVKYENAGEALNQYPAVVSKETFAKVQTILRARAENSTHRTGGSYLSTHNAFSGLCNEMKSGCGVQYRSCNNKKRGYKYEYLRAQNTLNTGLQNTYGVGANAWAYQDFENLFLATCRLAMKAATNLSKEEAALAILETEAAEVSDSMQLLLQMAKKATTAKSSLLTELEKEATKKEKIEASAEALRDRIRSTKKRRATLPEKIKSRVELRNILRANVSKIEIDFENKLFTCRLFSGVEYSCWLSNNAVFVETSDFEVPAGAFNDLILKQKTRAKAG